MSKSSQKEHIGVGLKSAHAHNVVIFETIHVF